MLVILLLAACVPKGRVDSDPPDLDRATIEFKTSTIKPDEQIAPQTKPAREVMQCPALDSQLNQLIQMEDPSGSAAKLGMKVKGDAIQVLITLSDNNAAFLSDFNADVGTQSGNQVQAYVPFDQLCSLANVDSVLAIHPSAQAIPLN